MGSQASSLRFLAGQGFDFNRWVRDGIGYMTADERDTRLAELKYAADGKQVRALSIHWATLATPWQHWQSALCSEGTRVNSIRRATNYARAKCAW